MGLRWRITIPFLALFLAAAGAMTFLSVRLVERAVERRFQTQTDDLARLMSSQGFPINAQSVAYIREAYGAEVTLKEGERTIESTYRPGREHREVRAPLPGQGRTLILHFPKEIVDHERTRVVRPVLTVGVVAIALTVVLGFLLAHAIARPLERLASLAGHGPVERVGGGPEMDRLVEALNRMANEIRRSEQLAVMGQMAAAVAHEIRNPLTAMKMNVQMLLESASDPEPYRILLREVERLELAALELAGQPERPAPEETALGRLVDEVLELLRPQLAHLRIRVEKRYEEVPPVRVDVGRFKRAVMNLVLNGAQAMPRGGTLTVGIRTMPRGTVGFSVSDAGTGIPSAIRDRMFEPFVTTKQDGVGLGLVMTKRIVEEHGGTIAFETSERGTTFTVELHG